MLSLLHGCRSPWLKWWEGGEEKLIKVMVEQRSGLTSSTPPHHPPGGVALTEGWSSGQRRQHAWVQPPHCAIYKLTRAVDAELFTFMPPRGRQQDPNARAKDQVRDVYSSPPAGIWSWTLTKIFRRGLESSGGALKIKHLGVSFSCCASPLIFQTPGNLLSLWGIFCHAVCSVQSMYSNP